jgi:hypothetical protein
MRPIPKSSKKSENYEVLNLIGYGLAKFNLELVSQFGFSTKSDFYKYLVTEQVARTIGTIKNRQDLFDPLFPNSIRKGWWQQGAKYMHRKDLIDSLFGDLDVQSYARRRLYFGLLKPSSNNELSGCGIRQNDFKP